MDCPDVGMIFGLVDNATVPSAGTPSSELIDLDESGVHALVDATLTHPFIVDSVSGEALGGGDLPFGSWKVQLRFEPTLTATRFGNCHDADGVPGVRIVENERQSMNIVVAAENLFRSAISTSAPFSLAPFALADGYGNGDQIVTMAELDAYPLANVYNDTGIDYELPAEAHDPKTADPSLGDFVRFLFRFTMLYQTPDGLCVGDAPGTP